LFARAGGPAIVRLPQPDPVTEPRYLALLGGSKRHVTLLCPDLHTRGLRLAQFQGLICAPYETYLGDLVEQVLADAGTLPNQTVSVRAAILRDQLGPLRIDAGWLLRIPPSASMRNQLRQSGAYRPATVLLGMYVVQQILSIASWFVIGRGIFGGHFDLGWLAAWAILMLSTVPVQVIVSNAQSELSMNLGALFKGRLIQGVLKLDPEEIRSQGMGQFLNRVMESEAVEMLAFGGGFSALLAVIELGLAFGILWRGAGGPVSAFSLLGWALLTLAMLWRYFEASRDWTETYREMTNRLVEGMVGHRTRLIQEEPAHWHDDEDQELDRYLKLSESLDKAGVQLNALVSRGWILVGLAGVALAFVSGRPAPQDLAISLGGVLLASQGLGKMAGGAQSLAGLYNAWKQVGPLFQAAARPRHLPALGFTPPPPGSVSAPVTAMSQQATNAGGQQPLIQARDVTFRYRAQGRPVLQDISLDVHPGDRLLVEGPSGGGKSTLAAVLTGLRAPESGSLLLWGFDHQILGTEEWRRRVVMAPQFQENYVFSETFAFNLLMGRRWPPQNEDLEEAEAICRELGLGALLARMPSGFQQSLGESGWQLSHGERSRLYIARTLLQKADLVVLDESFGALDPENLRLALQCVLNRAPTLMVIAHP
jgi:ATP-binding cassette subfamily B protein